MNLNIENEDFANKTVLEIGCGLGRTTSNLVSLLSEQPGAKLIVTDVLEKHLDRIRAALKPLNFQPQFIKTDASVLDGISPESIDYIVCNFAICEINSTIGQGTVALSKFLSVLKPGGKLIIEEELPIYDANNSSQQNWANIWRVLKSAMILIKQRTPSNEYQPEVLGKICEIVGFTNIQWKTAVRSHGLDWMQARLNFLEKQQPGLPNPKTGEIFTLLAQNIFTQTQTVGKVDVPIYTLTASKP